MLAPFCIAVLMGSMLYVYLYPEDDVYEYWKQVEQGNVPVDGADDIDDDDDDDEDDDDDDTDEWDDKKWFSYLLVLASKERNERTNGNRHPF